MFNSCSKFSIPVLFNSIFSWLLIGIKIKSANADINNYFLRSHCEQPLFELADPEFDFVHRLDVVVLKPEEFKIIQKSGTMSYLTTMHLTTKHSK